MLTNFLLDHRELVPALVVGVVVVGVVLAFVLARRPRAAWVLCAAATTMVLVLTLVPTRRGRLGEVRCTVQWSLPTFGTVELMANVALFVLPTMLAAVALRRPVVALLSASLASAVIEAIQALVSAIGRACDTNDWFCNTLGAAVGVVLAAVVLGMHRRLHTSD